MSTRWYPIYQRGNPQLRVFLPNFWMKLVKEPKGIKAPPNKAQFFVSSEMTKLDVKNYLEKIYQIPVMEVVTKNLPGHTHKNVLDRRNLGELYKDDDVKVAYVTFPKDYKWEFPDVTTKPETDQKSEKKAESEVVQAKKEFKKSAGLSKGTRKGIPTFFGL